MNVNDSLNWQSKLTLEEVFSSQQSFAYPDFLSEGYLYLTTLVEQKGRSVLQYGHDGSESCITPSPFSLRTKINEYGGKPYWVTDKGLIFANQADQCLYRQSPKRKSSHDQNDGERDSISQLPLATEFTHPERISRRPDDRYTYMYTDVHHLSDENFIAIIELNDNQKSSANNVCFIGLIDASRPDSKPKVLLEGADFYSNLVLASNNQIAWVQWNHPMMPWDENQLMMANIGADFSVEKLESIADYVSHQGVSFCQLAFSNSDKLLFSFDVECASGVDDYWNVYSWNAEAKTAEPLSQEKCEFGYPHWQYGDLRIVSMGNNKMLAVGSDAQSDALFLLNTLSGQTTKVYENRSTIQYLATNKQGKVLALESGSEDRMCMVMFKLSEGSLLREVIKDACPYTLPVSKARSISYSCRDGGMAHGYYYPPIDHGANNHDAKLDIDSHGQSIKPPPLLVMVHGGPTARAYSHFDIQKQFWCSNGFAVFDVNHRGSNGYGRKYRDALYGLWGELDCTDIVDGIAWLADQHLADTKRVCIRGKSAGGYAVLRALTEYPQVFRAGACYYGIGNLATLADVTHKFEKHYTDRLIAEPYDPATASLKNSNYYQRSPVNKINNIRSAMIIFQGSQDKVVPPSVAHEVIDKLAANDISHEYVEYPDEGHGFRQTNNNIDAWSRELRFYKSTLQNIN